ncbi:MAG TPA: twin-arginine translocase subunit TatC [Solirubrobacterales bacterium]|nr:twin-arginine translocase subunit TatC [Solirubrobacterales bacterium]
MARLKPAEFDERMTLVEHLDELRSRIIFCLIALALAFALCFWQSDLLFDLATEPLDGRELLTLSPVEPFFTTVELAGYGAALLALPLILYQVYAFVLPAFSPHERSTLRPFLVAIPILFFGGVAFAYFVVMPVAIEFLLDFNEEQFNTQVRSKEYLSFFGLTMLAMALLFQIPIVMLSLTRLEIVEPDFFSRNRRYAIFIISVVAAALPGGDPVSMLLIMLPLLLLYEGSIIVARRFGRPPEPAFRADMNPGEAA